MTEFWNKVDVRDYTDVYLISIGFLRASLYDFWKDSRYPWGDRTYVSTFEEIDLMDALLLAAVPAGEDSKDRTSSP